MQILGFRVLQNVEYFIFYGALFSVFNKCKKPYDVNALKQDEFMCQLIWNNTLFQYKSKTLCIKNWIEDGIDIQLFNNSGEIFDTMFFMHK